MKNVKFEMIFFLICSDRRILNNCLFIFRKNNDKLLKFEMKPKRVQTHHCGVLEANCAVGATNIFFKESTSTN